MEERGIFKDGPQSQLLDIHEDIPLRTRHNWRRWVDIGIVSAFTGLLLATAAALRYTVPMDQAPPSWPPSNLTQQVEQEMQMQRIRKQEACELACAEVNRYLGAASELAASSYLIPPPPGMDAPAFPPFLSPPSEWTVSDSKRIPFTDRYLTIVKPANGESPVFMVEQTESGLFRLHAGPIAQQSMNLAGKFLASAGQGEATLYAEVRPTVPGFERGYRATRPDLDSYRLVDVLPAFSEKPEAFIACFKPGSDAAMYFSRRGAQDLNWRRVLVQVRWQVHREAGPWIEVVKFIPGPWSGDPPFPAPSATASLSPAN